MFTGSRETSARKKSARAAGRVDQYVGLAADRLLGEVGGEQGLGDRGYVGQLRGPPDRADDLGADARRELHGHGADRT
ncbi:hypothetical protein [Streptomyces sp. NPDC000134]|uniref:hypothetical protein n=1 Tax=Streptomyces sp. NPDC000134 TaxID=3364536 RepID=UPI00368678DC